MPRPARGGVSGDGRRRRYGLPAGSGRILDEGMKTPIRNLLLSVFRLCNVYPCPTTTISCPRTSRPSRLLRQSRAVCRRTLRPTGK